MSATYNSSLTSDLDKVRFLIQDTDVTAAQLQDEEINGTISMYGSYKAAAVACCEVLASKYAGSDDLKKIGNLTVSNFLNKSRKYTELARIIRGQVFKFISPYLGGQSISDKEINQDDDDNVQPSFKRGMMKQNVVINEETGD